MGLRKRELVGLSLRVVDHHKALRISAVITLRPALNF